LEAERMRLRGLVTTSKIGGIQVVDTTKIKTVIEPYIQNWLSTCFLGHVFKKKPVPLTTGSSHRFDAVAEDGSIVGAILCNRPRTRTGRENTGAVRKARNDVTFLKLLPSVVKKLMIFTDAGCCDLIRRRAARLGTESIDMMVCTLPPNLAKLLRNILDEASNEQRAAE